MTQRTTITLTEENHAWLKERCGKQGDLSTTLNALVQEARLLKPLHQRLEALVEKLEQRLERRSGQGELFPRS